GYRDWKERRQSRPPDRSADCRNSAAPCFRRQLSPTRRHSPPPYRKRSPFRGLPQSLPSARPGTAQCTSISSPQKDSGRTAAPKPGRKTPPRPPPNRKGLARLLASCACASSCPSGGRENTLPAAAGQSWRPSVSSSQSSASLRLKSSAAKITNLPIAKNRVARDNVGRARGKLMSKMADRGVYPDEIGAVTQEKDEKKEISRRRFLTNAAASGAAFAIAPRRDDQAQDRAPAESEALSRLSRHARTPEGH